MSFQNAFLDKLSLALNADIEPIDPFRQCLMVMARQLGIAVKWSQLKAFSMENLQDYAAELQFTLYPIATEAMSQLAKSVFPILVYTLDARYLALVANKKGKVVVYDPLKQVEESIQDKIQIQQAWQCCPTAIPLRASFLGLLQLTARYFKKQALAILLLGGVVSATTVVVAWMASYVLTHMSAINPSRLVVSIFSFFTMVLVFSVIGLISDLSIKSLNAKLLLYVLPSFFNHVIKQPLKSVQHYLAGDLVQRLMEYESALSALLSAGLSIVFGAGSLLLLFVYMAYCNVKLACWYFFITGMFTVIKCLLLPHNLQQIAVQSEAQGKLSAWLNEIFLQIHKIRSAAVESLIFKKWISSLIHIKQYAERSIKIEITLWSIEALIPVILLLIFYGWMYFQPKLMAVSTIFQLMICAGQFTGIVEKLSSDTLVLLHLMPTMARVKSIMATAPETMAVDQHANNLIGKITFSSVSLRHPGVNGFIVEDVSMQIQPGEFIAIIGESGAGKSTLLRLLLGFESPSSGSILIDNENRNIHALRKQFGVVLQTTNIMPGSILSNISANKQLTLDQAWELARAVGLAEDIQAMPMKMHTYLSENAGESISGGQKQKILIARALATQPKILLLDEATSALDNNSQAIIYAYLKKLNITRIVIAHRHSTIVDADRIYVMHQGRIVESGTYAQITSSGLCGPRQ